jgi:hypothetical protein
MSRRKNQILTEGFRLDQAIPSLTGDFICSKLKAQIDFSKKILAKHIEADAVSSASQTTHAIMLLNESFQAHKCHQYDEIPKK